MHDHRAYNVKYVGDFLWTRVLDTPAALSARRYAAEGSLVIDVVDEFRPDGAAGGRFRLDASPDGATCTPVDRSVDADVTAPASPRSGAPTSAASSGRRWPPPDERPAAATPC